MSLRDIKIKYGKKDGRQAMSAAIRAEMVGGDDLLDSLETVYRLATRLKERGLAGSDEAYEALDALTRLRELMGHLILQRYQSETDKHTHAREKTMQPTAADYEKLARAYCRARYGNDAAWEDEAIDEDNDLVVVTRETLDDFRIAAKTQWAEANGREEFDGVIYWESVQARKGDRRESLTVVDCGDFRLCYKV